MWWKRATGFTLAELLICILILGEIATFTIPKLIVSQQNKTYNSQAKEAIAMISGAFQAAKLTGAIDGTGTLSTLTPYFNYVKVDTTTVFDDVPGYTTMTCSGSNKCYRLHGGGLLYDRCGFGGTGTTSAMLFHFDPDSKYSGSTTTPGKSILVEVFWNGRVITRELETGTIATGCGDWVNNSNSAPDWFSW
jgi:type II secretory pathway pseudopilin PulG